MDWSCGAAESMYKVVPRPAFYAAPIGGWRDWWTLLHPPYTAWHLSYVVLGAVVAPELNMLRLLATLTAFFLAVGIAAHALDELYDRPLRTAIPDAVLVIASVLGLGGAMVLGLAGISVVGWLLIPFIACGTFLVLAYDLEWFGGLIHTDTGFALAWGSFPVLTGYLAQSGSVSIAAVLMAAGGFALSRAQRTLSNRARALRRRTAAVDGQVQLTAGGEQHIDREYLLHPLEEALAALSWTAVLIAVATAVFRFT